MLSAFLINDVVCVALTPLVLHLARRMKFDPMPHLIGLATAANVGSTGTITGNPQNIYIGAAFGHLVPPLCRPAAAGGPVGLVIDYLVIAVVYRGALGRRAATAGRAEDDRPCRTGTAPADEPERT